jgi:branched-chain amino acid transport system ATP-binding protein
MLDQPTETHGEGVAPEFREAETLLEVNNVEVIYNHVILVLKGVSLKVPKGGITALLGGNGAGKTTTLKAISNLLHSERGEVTKGAIKYRGEPVADLSPSDLVDQGRHPGDGGAPLFRASDGGGEPPDREPTRGRTGKWRDRCGRSEMVYSYFPRLKERRRSQAGYTSGGEQQMTAIGRALMSRPETILLDEPSMGLAPQLVEQIFDIVKRLNEEQGVTFLLAEQNTNVALRFAHYGYILESGRVVMDGPAADLRENPDVKEFYLGMSEEGRKSFRDVRSYRRRKRWLS